MARTAATLPAGSRITDYMSLGVVAKTFPRTHVDDVLKRTGRTSARQRDLPAHVVVYYVIALALFMQASYGEVLRCLLEGVQWLMDKAVEPKVSHKSSISQARIRLGWEPMKVLHDEIVKPIATPQTRGAWFRNWRLVSIDGSTLDVPDEAENEAAFGSIESSRGKVAFPKVRFVCLCELGTHVMFGSCVDSYEVGEVALAEDVLPLLEPGMLCLADRGFNCFKLWKLAQGTGADLLWRLRKDMNLPREKQLQDGSYLSTFYEYWYDRKKSTNGIRVRVVEYTLEGMEGAEPIYRLATTILDPEKAPARELAALYHERWEIESAFDELKTHLRGRQVTLRSKTPDLVRQEFYGMMMAHFSIRGLMHEAALKGDVDPDRLSFLHAVRVIRRKLTRFASLPPSGEASIPSERPV
ncbi:IS4 family transposase [Mesoterricola sediminis]|uniref:Transposase n=1 Tax=Mesoterricola sediminis TaxID=2927980 RepID=A0AA48KG93_9BACT|nr:IS4 family transposase [Mesoterricola sediminis]BDU77213.1 transposase [Mesoterricola sediminis]BDU77353.1 transposase [Mesoterricola sediminis]